MWALRVSLCEYATSPLLVSVSQFRISPGHTDYDYLMTVWIEAHSQDVTPMHFNAVNITIQTSPLH